MTRNDTNWGTGLDLNSEEANNPSQWRGTNILGWALTEAREALLVAQERKGKSGKTIDKGEAGQASSVIAAVEPSVAKDVAGLATPPRSLASPSEKLAERLAEGAAIKDEAPLATLL